MSTKREQATDTNPEPTSALRPPCGRGCGKVGEVRAIDVSSGTSVSEIAADWSSADTRIENDHYVSRDYHTIDIAVVFCRLKTILTARKLAGPFLRIFSYLSHRLQIANLRSMQHPKCRNDVGPECIEPVHSPIAYSLGLAEGSRLMPCASLEMYSDCQLRMCVGG